MVRLFRLVSGFVAIAMMFSPPIGAGADDRSPGASKSIESMPTGWQVKAPRDEIRPQFDFDSNGGPDRRGAFVISTSDSVGENGWFQKSFPVTGGKFIRFEALRKTDHVAAPFRSAIVRIVWLDAQGKSVLSDLPEDQQSTKGPIPLAEPEHPLDAETTSTGWTAVTGTYRVPTRATQAIVESHLQWAPNAICRWSNVTFDTSGVIISAISIRWLNDIDHRVPKS